MLATIYYAIGILVLLSTLSSTVRFGKIYSIKEWKEKYEKVIGKKPNRREFRTKKEYSIIEAYHILSLFELFWVFIGLFTHNWYIFGFLLSLSFILNWILKPIKWTIFYKISLFLFLLVKISLYLYLVVNHFYLHIDTYSFILNKISK